MIEKNKIHFKDRGFSLIELIVAVVVIGIITFMVVPNLVKSKKEVELSEVITRVQALNMAIATYSLSETLEAGRATWQGISTSGRTTIQDELFSLVSPYLSYRGNLPEYIRDPYSIEFPNNINGSVELFFDPDGAAGPTAPQPVPYE